MAKSSKHLESEIDRSLAIRADDRRVRGGGGVDLAARRANDAIYEVTKGSYFSHIPLDKLFSTVEGAGFTLNEEEKQCILTGRDGKATWELFVNGKSANRMLVLTWHRMDVTGRYEVVAYVS